MAGAEPDRIAVITTTTRPAPTVADPSALLVISSAVDGREADYVLARDVALIVTERGDGCIVDLNGSFYAVSSVGAAMLRDTVESGRAAAITRNAAKYGVQETRIATDLDDLLGDMIRRGLLQRGRGRHSPGIRHALANVIAGIMRLALRFARAERSRAWIALTLARVSFLLLGWNATVGAWRTRLAGERSASPDARRAIDESVRSVAARHMMNVDCKERALACFALARSAGLPATLVVGVDFYPLAGHSWCESGPDVIGDEVAHCRRFTPAFRLS